MLVFVLKVFSYLGISDAQNRLGRRYEDGVGVLQDYTNAFKWYSRASQSGNVYAHSNLGRMFEFGYCEKQDIEAAIKLYEKAASKNHAWSQNNLGHMLSSGQYNIAVNYEKAVEWFEKASKQGFLGGYMNLAWAYYNGYGIVQDYTKSLEYYEKSSSIPQAKYCLGLMHAEGLGTKVNNEEAYKLLKEAYESGVQEAKIPMNIAKSYITSKK